MKLSKQKTIKTIALASSAGAIAFFCYKFYKTYKEVKAAQAEDERIEREMEERELRLAAESEEETRKEFVFSKFEEKCEEPVEDNDEPISEVPFMGDPKDALLYTDDDPPEDIMLDYNEEEEEGKVELRFPPNSPDAWAQYINMRIADYSPREQDLLIRLFGFQYYAYNPEDADLKKHVYDSRLDFFGPDTDPLDGCTWAEIFLYFAELASFDLDRPAADILVDFFYNVEFYNAEDEHLSQTIMRVLRHEVGPGEKYGIFGLPNYWKCGTLMQEYWKYLDITAGGL